MERLSWNGQRAMVNANDRNNRTTESLARAGRYVNQPAGYRAFMPAPLPPTPPIQLVGDLQHALSEADRALGPLGRLPNPDLFVFMQSVCRRPVAKARTFPPAPGQAPRADATVA